MEEEDRCENKEIDVTSDRSFHQYTLFDVTVDPGLKDDYGNELPRPFTKSQMRKWLKRVRWEKNKVKKRLKEKARLKERLKEAQMGNLSLGLSRKALKFKREGQSKRNMGVILDYSFDDLMSEKEMCKLIKQTLRCYSVNRRSHDPLQFHITSFGQKSIEFISRHNGYESWDVEYHKDHYLKLFSKEQLVYLTSESENIIENFEENTFYIIGGLVDHNKYKGHCLNIATEQGIRHARLPLSKYIDMKTRKVLTVDHVFEIVLHVSENVPWQEVLINVLPERKVVGVCNGNSSPSGDMSDQSEINE